MLGTLRFAAVGLVLAAAAPASLAGEKETLSELSQIEVRPTPDDAVVVTIAGSKAPDFTSFTMNEPFRVVVDWAGSKLGTVAAEKSYGRGLIRRISTKQFDSEEEKISRVTIELARETSYHVEADGKRVKVHFVPVADPIPEPEPEPVKEEPKVAPVKVAQAVPEGPLTEPDVAVPAELPPMPQKPAPVVVAKAETKPEKTKETPATTVAAAKKFEPPSIPLPKPEEKPADKKSEPAVVASAEAAKNEPPKGVPAPEPVKLELAKNDAAKKFEPPSLPVKTETPVAVAKNEPERLPQPTPIVQKTEDRKAPPVLAARSEPKNEKLASFPGVVPEKVMKQDPPKEVAAPTLRTTPASNPQRDAAVQTTRLASEMPQQHNSRASANVWQPPTVPIKQAATAPKRQLPVVKLASADDTLKPTSTLPADPDEPGANDAQKAPAKNNDLVSSGISSGGDEFDPGPRVMKYIGFQQMAEVSRVFVRCDGKAKFREVKGASATFTLELVNTSINVKNNERPLDTTYFNSAVQKIQAVKAGENTRIEVKLREAVPYKITRIGNTIAIDFSRS